ncbi:unnamed protein product [Umbelopsis vinacea]
MDHKEDGRTEQGHPIYDKPEEKNPVSGVVDSGHGDTNNVESSRPSHASQCSEEAKDHCEQQNVETKHNYGQRRGDDMRYAQAVRIDQHKTQAYRLSGVKTNAQSSNSNPYSRFQEEDIRSLQPIENNADSTSNSLAMPPRRSSTVPQELSVQDVVAARKVNVLSNDIHSDLDITTGSSRSSLSQSSSKTLIGRPKPTLYSNKSTPYTSVISGLSTPAKISHSNTHHYLPVTEGEDLVIIDVKHEIVDPDFDTSLQEKRRPVNKRGVCNLMTIVIILAIIVFMFAGYPLSLYISKQLHPTTPDSNTGYSPS